MKKILSVLLVVSCLLGIFAVTASAATYDLGSSATLKVGSIIKENDAIKWSSYNKTASVQYEPGVFVYTDPSTNESTTYAGTSGNGFTYFLDKFSGSTTPNAKSTITIKTIGSKSTGYKGSNSTANVLIDFDIRHCVFKYWKVKSCTNNSSGLKIVLLAVWEEDPENKFPVQGDDEPSLIEQIIDFFRQYINLYMGILAGAVEVLMSLIGL